MKSEESPTAERDLQKLLRQMNPDLQKGEYVICTLPSESLHPQEIPCIGMFREQEGITMILEKKVAEEYGFSFGSAWRLITLSVHSALDAVGFLAAITGHLASEGIGVNVISAYYHDHLLLSAEQAPRAMEVLQLLSRNSGQIHSEVSRVKTGVEEDHR